MRGRLGFCANAFGVTNMADNTRLDILICTFQRDSLETCLRSVLAQTVPNGLTVGIIVTDNAAIPFAANIVANIARYSAIPIHYIHAPAANISVARNACLDASHADWIVFIDDDEHAPQGWLQHLWDDVRGHDVVFGDVLAIYPDQAPDWIKNSNFHTTKIDPKAIPINTGFAGNVIIRWRGSDWFKQRFDLALGTSGGEDTAFFHAVYQLGAKMGVSRRGFVWEPVPISRLSLRWLVRRRFRAGQSYAGIALNAQTPISLAMVSTAKAMFSAIATLCHLWHPTRRGFWTLRMVFHLGVGSHCFRGYGRSIQGQA